MTSSIEHIGEARPPINGDCSAYQYLVWNKNRTSCIFPARLDIGRHFLMTGGKGALKEGYDRIVSRALSFIGFIFGNDYGEYKEELDFLFKGEQYVKSATKICGGKSYFDPIQLGIIIMLPGQTVPMHFDVPYFFGATRFHIPQWLLVVMETSGLFKDIRIPQVQGVAYLHQWENNVYNNSGGQFFYYPEGPGGVIMSIDPIFNSAIVLDGSIVVHGVDLFKKEYPFPILNKSDKNDIRYEGNDEWSIYVNGVSKHKRYQSKDLRISLVWRARCFKDEEEKKKYDNAPALSIPKILDILYTDLKKKGVIKEAPKDLMEAGLLLVDHYVNYPYPDTLVPINYCMLGALYPKLNPYLSYINC